MKTTSSERRLHPVSIILDAVRSLPQVLLPFLLLLFATRSAFLLTWIAVLAALALIAPIVRYFRITYRYDERELVVRSGLVTRSERRIPYARIQNLDASQGVLHRLLGVAVVYVQTGGGAEPEASLRGLPVAALDEMRARVLSAGGRAGAATAPDASLDERASQTDGSASERARTLLALGPRELLLAGFIENRGMVLILGAIALLDRANVTERLITRLFDTDEGTLSDIASQWLGGVPVIRAALYLAGALLVILLFIRVLSTVWAVIRLYGFRVDRTGDDLHTEYGLFTRVTATIPLRRVQTVIVEHGVLHRMLGRCRVHVTTAGGIAVENGRARREPIAPILRIEQLPALLELIQPGLSLAGVDWQPAHPRAFGRMLRGALFRAAAVSLVAYVFVDAWALAILAVLGVRAVLHARLRSRYLAWTTTADSFIVRDGALKKTTRVARFSRIQVVELYRSPLDRRTGMARVRADTAGTGRGVTVAFLPESTAAALQPELAVRAAETA